VLSPVAEQAKESASKNHHTGSEDSEVLARNRVSYQHGLVSRLDALGSIDNC